MLPSFYDLSEGGNRQSSSPGKVVLWGDFPRRLCCAAFKKGRAWDAGYCPKVVLVKMARAGLNLRTVPDAGVTQRGVFGRFRRLQQFRTDVREKYDGIPRIEALASRKTGDR